MYGQREGGQPAVSGQRIQPTQGVTDTFRQGKWHTYIVIRIYSLITFQVHLYLWLWPQFRVNILLLKLLSTIFSVKTVWIQLKYRTYMYILSNYSFHQYWMYSFFIILFPPSHWTKHIHIGLSLYTIRCVCASCNIIWVIQY